MDDPERVRFRERDTDFDDVARRLFDRELLLAFELDAEVLTFEVLEHHVRLARFEPADVVDTAHMLALHLRCGTRLPDEALDRNGCAFAEKELDRDALLEL